MREINRARYKTEPAFREADLRRNSKRFGSDPDHRVGGKAGTGRADFRSGFEKRLRGRLDAEGVKYAYEAETFPIQVPVGTTVCPNCGPVRAVKNSRYTPDFFFKSWIIEAKGKFTAKDRKRFWALRQAHGDKHRFGILFMRDNWMTKRKAQRYTDWCRTNDIPCAVGWFKPEWLK